MFLAMLDRVYGCEFAYVDETEEKAKRELVKKVIKWRGSWSPTEDATFGHHSIPHLTSLKRVPNKVLDDIADYYGVHAFPIEKGKFFVDKDGS